MKTVRADNIRKDFTESQNGRGCKGPLWVEKTKYNSPIIAFVEISLTLLTDFHSGRMWSLGPGKEEPLVIAQAGDCLAGEQLWWRDLGVLVVHKLKQAWTKA